uniref:Uncharacterized protein n=1 Tax=Fagus sylvatica TaxID=28930 RepID=A0A2N9F6M1_FAGSY
MFREKPRALAVSLSCSRCFGVDWVLFFEVRCFVVISVAPPWLAVVLVTHVYFCAVRRFLELFRYFLFSVTLVLVLGASTALALLFLWVVLGSPRNHQPSILTLLAFLSLHDLLHVMKMNLSVIVVFHDNLSLIVFHDNLFLLSFCDNLFVPSGVFCDNLSIPSGVFCDNLSIPSGVFCDNLSIPSGVFCDNLSIPSGVFCDNPSVPSGVFCDNLSIPSGVFCDNSFVLSGVFRDTIRLFYLLSSMTIFYELF